MANDIKELRQKVADMLPAFIERNPLYTQASLAKKLGIARKTLYVYRKNPRDISPYTLNKMLWAMRQLEFQFEDKKGGAACE